MGEATGELTIAEEIIDSRITNIQFQGRSYEMKTGRVLLHAVGADGHVICGRPVGHVEAIAQRWHAGYLTHLARCRICTGAAASDGPSQTDAAHYRDQASPALPAAGVDVRTVHGSDDEVAGAAALSDVIAAHDVRPWLFTDLVRVDARIRGGFSHPLTLNPKLLVGRAASALTNFLHEQLHWIDAAPAIDSATTEAAARWPDPPPPPAGGHDAESSWLHVSICTLEYLSLSQLIGQTAAEQELGQHEYYSWLYSQILADPGWFADFVARHGLGVPDQPPVPRRYLGDDWWTSIPGVVPSE